MVMADLNLSFNSYGGGGSDFAIRSRLSIFSPVRSVPICLHVSYNQSTASTQFSALTSSDRSNKVHTTLHSLPHFSSLPCRRRGARRIAAAMTTGNIEEVLPPALDSTSDPPPFFDGTTRLYMTYTCPYAQRVWITRNCKGLQDKIKLVALEQNRPDWYKKNVNPSNKVPSLEHNNEIKVESLDLIKYIDSQFEGPSLFPHDPTKKDFAEELFSYTDTFMKTVVSSFNVTTSASMSMPGAAFDYLETALSKFDDGPFFLGQFSLVDIAYAPFIERYQPFLSEVKNYDITINRPLLAAWIEEMNKNEGYKQTKRDPREHVESYKKRFIVLSSSFSKPCTNGESLQCSATTVPPHPYNHLMRT